MHMTAGGLRNHPEDEKMEKIRFYQIQQLIKAVSDKTPTILAGDLNAGPDTSQRNYQALMEAGFIDAFVETGNTGITWDPDNPLVASGNENHLPVQRIDHIFINQAALELLKPVDGNVVLNKNLVELSDGSKIPISDHYGLNIHFEIAG